MILKDLILSWYNLLLDIADQILVESGRGSDKLLALQAYPQKLWAQSARIRRLMLLLSVIWLSCCCRDHDDACSARFRLSLHRTFRLFSHHATV